MSLVGTANTPIIGTKIILGDTGSVYSHYDTLSEKARVLYGQRTVTFVQIGDFFEAYFKPDSTDPTDTLLLELSEQFLMTRSVKSNGLYMMGFPLASEERYIDAFLAKGWSVCIVDQIMETSFDNFEDTSIIDATGMTDTSFHDATNRGKAKRKVLYRIVRAVYTPGSHEDATNDINNVVCVSYYTYRGKTYIGVCCMELKTGHVTVHQFTSDPKNANYLNESLYKFITENTPKEIRIYTNSKLTKDYFESILRREVTVCNLPEAVAKLAYREGVLWQTYKDILPGISDLQVALHTYMNLADVPYAASALIVCINYISSTNRALLQRVSVPEQLITDNVLSIHYNASEQLNLVDTNRTQTGRLSSLFKVINETTTDIGVHSLHQLHTRPYTNPDILNTRYDIIEYLIKSPALVSEFTALLGWMKCVARLQSKFAIGKIDHVSLYRLLMCYTHFEQLHIHIPAESKITGLSPTDFTLFQSMLNDIRLSVSEEILKTSKCDFIDSVKTLSDLVSTPAGGSSITAKETSTPAKETSTPVGGPSTSTPAHASSIGDLILDTIVVSDPDKMALLRKYTAELKATVASIETFVSTLENGIRTVKGRYAVGYIRHITVKYVRKCGTAAFAIQTTEIGKKHLAEATRKSILTTEYTVTASKDSKTKFDIHTPETDTSLQKIHRLMYCILAINEYFTHRLVNYLYTKYTLLYPKVLHVIANIDILVSFAKVSLKYNYCKPKAVSADKSFVTATALRHPLLERVLYDNGTGTYVPNDISIGTGKPAGILLYSMNGVGKSSLMKSIGSAVYMAQLGCFAPADTFTFSPFSRIMTRIDSSDDMFQGMSSFAKEITELSSIVLQADCRTLVLADEICKGTESDSAYAITSATIEYLCARGSAFVVSSHIHEIAESCILQDHFKGIIRVCHLNVIETHTVLPDKSVTSSLTYTRKLLDGKCKSLYGVEIARVLGYPCGILARAEAYRDEKLRRVSDVLDTAVCVYNKNFHENECLRCGNNEIGNLDTHHVIPQHSADEQGFVVTVSGNKIHKDDVSNLVRLCKQCHRDFHNKGTFRIETVPKARRVFHYTVDL